MEHRYGKYIIPMMDSVYEAIMNVYEFQSEFGFREANAKVIQAIMGHKNIKTALEIYADATIEKKQESIESFFKDMG